MGNYKLIWSDCTCWSVRAMAIVRLLMDLLFPKASKAPHQIKILEHNSQKFEIKKIKLLSLRKAMEMGRKFNFLIVSTERERERLRGKVSEKKRFKERLVAVRIDSCAGLVSLRALWSPAMVRLPVSSNTHGIRAKIWLGQSPYHLVSYIVLAKLCLRG